jgi:hypothetical protein
MQARPRVEAEIYFGGNSPMVYYSQLVDGTNDEPTDSCAATYGGILRNYMLRRAFVSLPL